MNLGCGDVASTTSRLGAYGFTPAGRGRSEKFVPRSLTSSRHKGGFGGNRDGN